MQKRTRKGIQMVERKRRVERKEVVEKLRLAENRQRMKTTQCQLIRLHGCMRLTKGNFFNFPLPPFSIILSFLVLVGSTWEKRNPGNWKKLAELESKSSV